MRIVNPAIKFRIVRPLGKAEHVEVWHQGEWWFLGENNYQTRAALRELLYAIRDGRPAPVAGIMRMCKDALEKMMGTAHRYAVEQWLLD